LTFFMFVSFKIWPWNQARGNFCFTQIQVSGVSIPKNYFPQYQMNAREPKHHRATPYNFIRT